MTTARIFRAYVEGPITSEQHKSVDAPEHVFVAIDEDVNPALIVDSLLRIAAMIDGELRRAQELASDNVPF